MQKKKKTYSSYNARSTELVSKEELVSPLPTFPIVNLIIRRVTGSCVWRGRKRNFAKYNAWRGAIGSDGKPETKTDRAVTYPLPSRLWSFPRIEFRRESREPLIFAASNLATSDFQLRGIEEWNSGEGWDRLSCDRPPVYEYLRRADGQRPMRPAQASLLRVAFRRRRGEGKRRRKKRKWRMLHGSTISQRKKKEKRERASKLPSMDCFWLLYFFSFDTFACN